MSRSEIFDAYEKLAIEAGMVPPEHMVPESNLIRTAAEDERKESPALRRYKKSPAPRAGSDSISTIEALYGVRPETIPTYDENIFEAAHPNAVVIGPAYDRMNGLIETPNERQRFIINQIADKTNNGMLTNHRYAREELLMELVRVANHLDATNNEPLRRLADSCIERLSAAEPKPIQKSALVFIPWLIGAAVVLTATWLWNHADDPNHGLANNIRRSLRALENLRTNSWYESNIDETVKRDVTQLETALKAYAAKVALFQGAVSQIETVTTPTDAAGMVSLKSIADEHSEEITSELNEFTTATEHLIPQIINAIDKFTSQDYQESHTEQNWLGQAAGWLGEAVHGRYGLFANDFISAANALGALKTSLTAAYRKATSVEQVKKSFHDDLQARFDAIKGPPGGSPAGQAASGQTFRPAGPSVAQPAGPFHPGQAPQGGELEDDAMADDVEMDDAFVVDGAGSDGVIDAAQALGYKPRGEVSQ